jgi:opacity protein-like surface antigen
LCGWYLSIGGAWTGRETVHELGNPHTFLTWNDGFSLNGAIGYDFDVVRTEFEIGFTNNGVDDAGAGIPNVGNFASSADGNVSLRKFMFNLYYDFDFKDSKVRPYVGAGVGFYQSEINGLSPDFFGGLGLGATAINATSNFPFAYQLKGGLSYALSQRTEVYSGYTFFHGESLDFAAAPFGRFHPDGAVTHSLELGLRFRL